MRVIHTFAVQVRPCLQFQEEPAGFRRSERHGEQPAGCPSSRLAPLRINGRHGMRTASPTRQAALRNRVYIGLVFVLLGFVARGGAQTRPGVAPRITARVDEAVRTTLPGNTHPLARPEYDQGLVDPSMPMRVTLVFKMTAAEQADLDALLAAQQQRGSPDYQRWLTPEQFGSRFGRSQNDINKVTRWLESAGFRVEGVAASRNMITFSGTARQVEAALGMEMHRYLVNGEARYANASEPSIPAALADEALAFRGLNNFRLKPRAVRMDPRFTSSLSGAHYLTPPDFATIYDLNRLYQQKIDGTNQKIAVVGQSDIRLTDIEAFRNSSKLAPKDPQIVYVTTNPGLQQDDVLEASLDVEWSGAIAPNATVVFVVGDPVNGGGIFDALNYAIAPPTGVAIPAPVISISYGFCEQEVTSPSEAAFLTFLRNLTQQANAEGITIFAASGDLGAADCDVSTNPNSPAITASTQGLAVDLPGGLPNVTSVGGTEFTEGTGSFWQAALPGQDVTPGSALSYIPEGTWNETNTIVNGSPVGLAAGGGGSSIITSKPTWQVGAGVPNDGARDVPDVSLSASFLHDDYLICTENFDTTTKTFSTTCPTSGSFRNANGGLTAVGGTSAGAPAMAGIMALINQATNHPGGSGNINPVLYPMAAQVPAAFHDVTQGHNQVPFSDPCGAKTLIGYTASPGYDLATGLGSVDAFVMVNNWTSVLPGTAGSSSSSVDFSLAFSSTQMSVTKGSCGTAQLLLAPLHGFSGTPYFTCTVSSALGSATCSVAPVAAATSLLVPGEFNDRDEWWAPTGVIAILLAALGWVSIMFGGGRIPSFASRGWTWTKWVPVLSLLLLCVMGLSCSGGGSGNSGGNGNNLISNGGNNVTPPVAPAITGQPMSQSVIEGQPATFGVSASGTLPLSYQWTKNGAAISGATASSYTTSATAGSNQGDQFSVMVSNTAGSANSNSATLTVNVPYNFVVQVPSTTSTGSGTLTVTAQIGGISHSAQMALTVQ